MKSIERDEHRRAAKDVMRIMREATGRRAAMWGSSIVGFDSYSYTTDAGHSAQWMLTGFSPRKSSFTIYIMNGFSRYDALLGKLGPHKTSKSCLYIKSFDEINTDVLTKLIQRSTRDMRKAYPDR